MGVKPKPYSRTRQGSLPSPARPVRHAAHAGLPQPCAADPVPANQRGPPNPFSRQVSTPSFSVFPSSSPVLVSDFSLCFQPFHAKNYSYHEVDRVILCAQHMPALLADAVINASVQYVWGLQAKNKHGTHASTFQLSA